ncbi:MAG: DUF5063 domain-containing protein [Candidatus Azobacteroides pseudotrichonymphae]|jgi:hypothetical protein|uniref:DUF5063 domain-containing protein n=1 Tax=Azobacteroides pseudotrichonymphae genomovar. CFP2 TaxID=511995 RepID=B6YQJ2_AZOPC|nr:DUF5063 domain-containing protein [Candidatus Azobacteroides pseudotrichonymphae]BAG83464.1 conserved hypothetical protein [Candidatus Azobacteroides pseudotrichonymphae genomovar. CFP2]GMO37439.1 MAG: DUF5063 domain-containing protein [Candidatus Azobacteroides pseudotrichonymphae]
MQDIIYSKYTIDFARIALEYCMLVEKTKEADKKTFVNNMTKVLPLLYLKVSIIPEIQENYESNLKNKVDENFYSQVENGISKLLGNDNWYLETFHIDIQSGDPPFNAKISEDLADIYQDLGNFIAVFKNGHKETMNDSLILCIENFKKYWGQHLVNSLKALHFIKYKLGIEE